MPLMQPHNHTKKGKNEPPARPRRQPDETRCRFIRQLTSVDEYWVEVLGDSLFHDMNYYDLFTGMWLRHNSEPGGAFRFRKSELHRFMPHVSQRTAVKYVQTAIDRGLLVEETDSADLRSKRITMSPDLQRRIELFLDYAISIFETPVGRGRWLGALNVLKVWLPAKPGNEKNRT